MIKNSSESTAKNKSKGCRNIENGKEKIIEDINVIYHLPKGYVNIHKCLDDPKSPVRKDLLDILNFLKKKDPIIYHQMYILDGIVDYYKVSDAKKKAEIITKKVVEKGISEPVFIIPGKNYKTGIITNLLDEKEDPNIIVYTDPLLKNGDALDEITVKLLQNLVVETDRPQEVLKDINGTLYRLLAFRRIKKDLEKLRVAVDIEELTQP